MVSMINSKEYVKYDLDTREAPVKLNVGMQAPDFELPSHLEDRIRLSDYREKHHVVIAFFPLAWTPV
jgi:peroxiredoxin (alkyl hydroperoxide reductase subunit C)